ncbi:MAG: LytTR family DNA-binding domain-containing protein, partial [Usitatibacter sp.]
ESLIRLALAELTGQLDADVFWQIHRGTLVNMNEVAATRRDLAGRVFVKLKDGKTELPVSRAYAHLFKQM